MAHHNIEETFQAIRPKSRSRGLPNPAVIEVGVSSINGDLATSLSQAGQEIAQLRSVYQQQADLINANTQALLTHSSSSSGSSVAASIGHAASGLFGGLGLLSPLISGIASLFGGGSSAPSPLPAYVPPAPVSIEATLRAASQGLPLSSAQTVGAPASAADPAGVSQVSTDRLAPATTLSNTTSSVNSSALSFLSNATSLSNWNSTATNNYTSNNTSSNTSVAAQGAVSSPAAPPASAPSQITVHVNAMDSQSFMDRSADIASAVRQAMLNLHPINAVIADL